MTSSRINANINIQERFSSKYRQFGIIFPINHQTLQINVRHLMSHSFSSKFKKNQGHMQDTGLMTITILFSINSIYKCHYSLKGHLLSLNCYFIMLLKGSINTTKTLSNIATFPLMLQQTKMTFTDTIKNQIKYNYIYMSLKISDIFTKYIY